MYEHILVRYGEINTKGNNRSQLERLLLSNIQNALGQWPQIKVRRISSRTLVSLHGAPVEAVLGKLEKVFGIRSLSPVMAAPLDVAAITEVAAQVLEEARHLGSTFKVKVRRGNKQFPLDSMELARHVGGALAERFTELQVDVHEPNVTVHIDVRDDGAYVYADVVEGAGGFPVGMSGRVGALLSGGIDSPVAVWQAMRRGLVVDLVHFHSFPFTSERAQRKVEDLAKTLAGWSGSLNLNLVSLTQTQAAIRKSCPEGLRTILLRRMMFHISTALGKQYGWLAFVTGDSLGQVASQTLSGLHVVDEVTDLTIIRPLVTEDKLDIIRRAQAIGTYETSILPYDDCCSLFAPKRPKTQPKRDEVRLAEAELDVEGLIAAALQAVEVKKIDRDA